MVDDVFNDYQSTLMEVITDSLSKGETEILMGLQCLDSATDYTGYQGVESLISVLFVKSVEAPNEAKKIRQEIATDGTRLYTFGLLEKKKEIADELEAGYIPVQEVRDALSGLRKHIVSIDRLIDYEIIGTYSRVGDEATHFHLPKKMWGQTIENIRRQGKESKMFGSAIGKVLAMALDKRGFTSVIPLILAFRHAGKESGELASDVFLERCCSRVSRPQRFFTRLRERDEKKQDDIKAFKFYQDGKIFMNLNGIRAIARWSTLAQRRARERTGS